MKKLSKVELDVVVNEIINGVREKEEKKCELILSMNSNKDLYLSKIDEYELLKEKMESLKNELRNIENGFEEDGIRLNFCFDGYYGNRSNKNNKNKKYFIYLLEGKTMKGNFYNEVYNKVVLNNIDDEVNVKSFIEKFVKEFC